MKIVFLTPTHQSTARGNTVTVNRWESGLKARGHDVTVIENDQRDRIPELAPDILHAHHAVHCGPVAVAVARNLPQTRVVVSLGGTDLHGPAGSPEDAGRAALAEADAVIGPFAADGLKLREAFPESAPFHVVPRGVAVRESAPATPGPILRGAFIGGIRYVKGAIAALAWRARTETKGLALRLEFAGPLIEEDYGARFVEACLQDPMSNYRGVLEPGEVSQLLHSVDFLLNFSESEGASNAILEALAAGRPVAARAVPGNKELLSAAPREAAHLIDTSPAGFDAWFSWLDQLSKRPSADSFRAARNFVRAEYSCEAELEALLDVYRQLTCST